MDFRIAETGIARGSPPGTTTEVLRFGIPFAEIRVVSGSDEEAKKTGDGAAMTVLATEVKGYRGN
jgi:hypothetical protein